ncbi:potassium channel family protein [Metabacillus arenae]|uniref:Potassium channel protein n=1 Tax=Metabacillus arenae TaxID=2771434 RepID=A0A926S331_9BACI|nr:potassium channel family protein [Metabacillus arenae]MBD1382564.1 potassium channel protein [Metabacillus arenae]
MKSNKLLIEWLKWPIYVRIVLFVLLIILVFGEAITYIEPEQFPTVFEGIWWALVTISTVGYGDFAPTTVPGRLAGIILIFLGASFITAYFATLSAAAIQKQHSYLEGKVNYKQKEHVVIIGWNEKAHQIIHSFRKIKPHKQIVLIDRTLKQSPLIENVHFVHGNPVNDHTLLKANIVEADTVIITADQHRSELEADMQSVLVLLAVKGLNADIYSIIEILTEQQSNNAARAGADEIIKSYELSSQFIMSSFLSKNGLSKVYEELNPISGNFFKVIDTPPDYIGKTFREVHQLLMEEEQILLGTKKGELTKMNPPLSYKIETNDHLVILCH